MDHVRVNFTCTFTNYGACAIGLLDIESTQTAASAVSFSLGERFRSIGELEDKLKQYEESTFTKFWKRDCRTVEAARRRMDRPLSDSITYYEVTYSCIHGRRQFKERG